MKLRGIHNPPQADYRTGWKSTLGGLKDGKHPFQGEIAVRILGERNCTRG
ncbi:MAG: hypothetical protein QMD05_03550 [Candidatus Brocadiaceae bacterium]|nr:hypothetical protein [Candidatus Brocadiaceae bacterium]